MGINLNNVSYTYSLNKRKEQTKFVLNNVDVCVDNKDEFITIIGHTGSGKSTLVQLFSSLLVPSMGEAHYELEDGNIYDIIGNVKDTGKKYKNIGTKYSLRTKEEKIKFRKNVILKPLRQHVGLVFQFPEYQLFEETVLKDIMFGPKNFYKDEEKAKNAAIEAAKLLGIEDLLDKSPFALSGGQMRKVAIAGIIASNPNILVLDEPTAGMDPYSKNEFLNFLKKLNNDEHKTIIIITHDMDIVSKYSSRAIVLNNGYIKFDGKKEDLFKNEKLLFENHLNYPSIINLLIKLKEKTNKDIDIYKYTVEEAFEEIKRCLGDNHE